MKPSSRALLCLFAMGVSAPPVAADSLLTSNQSTLARGFALPGLGATAPAQPGPWRLSVDLTNEFVDKQEDGEALLLDGESLRYALRHTAAWGERGDWSIELPLLHTGGGFLDGIIEDWHDAFSLPDGGREDAPRDRYAYRYVRDGVVQFEAQDGATRLGDVQVGAGWALREGLMLRGLLKLPTGDEDKLAGGNFGAAAWADWALPFDEQSAFGGFASLGVSANEKAEVLEDEQNTLIPFGGIGLDARLLPSLQILGQLYAHAPLYDDSAIGALDRAGLQMTLGGRWCPGGGPCVELSFQEDLVVASSPDFSLRLALVMRP